jgi:hypothetical protein
MHTSATLNTAKRTKASSRKSVTLPAVIRSYRLPRPPPTMSHRPARVRPGIFGRATSQPTRPAISAAVTTASSAPLPESIENAMPLFSTGRRFTSPGSSALSA